jgi:transcriptional regulator GlxA family with amidase domain
MNATIFIYDGLTALDAVGPYEALSRLPEVKVCFVGLEAGMVRSHEGALKLEASKSIFEIEATEILLIPGGDGPTITSLLQNKALLSQIVKLHEKSIYTASVCTGAFFLGAAGLLKGLSVATHWRAKEFLPKFGATYSGERVSRSGKVFTSAGVSAGIELGVMLCSAIAGDEVAAAVELSLEYSPKPPFGGVPHLQAAPEIHALLKARLLQ